MNHLQSNNFTELWYDAMELIMKQGSISSPRGMMVREIIGLQLTLENARNNIIADHRRKLNYRFMVAEWLWIAAGRDDRATIDRYNAAYAAYAADAGSDVYAGAYGPRLHSQWDYVIEQLKKPDSRQAVASIWTPRPKPSRDIPCTLTAQYLLRDNVLHSVVTMRSSDLWRGIVYDMFNFTMLLNAVAGHIGAGVGSLTYQLGSAHLYEHDWKDVEQFYTDPMPTCMGSPALPHWTPAERILLRGNMRAVDCTEPWEHKLEKPWEHYVRVLRSTRNSEAFAALAALEAES